MTGHVSHEPDQATTPRPVGGMDRRTALRSAGLGVGALAALSACGGTDDAAGTVSSVASKAADAAKDAISKATIPVGGGKVFADAKVVVTQPTAGQFKAFSATCTHQGCTVAEVSGGTINCTAPCGHGSTFDISTGEVKNGPATTALATKTVTVSGDGIAVT